MQFELLELESTQVHFMSQNEIWDKFHQFILYIYIYIYDLVPKGAQEKRTEVLENKVDRM